MKHLPDCDGYDCRCAERIYLDSASDDERADWAARNSVNPRPLLTPTGVQHG